MLLWLAVAVAVLVMALRLLQAVAVALVAIGRLLLANHQAVALLLNHDSAECTAITQ
jgi:hypothetical protein